MSRHWRPDLTVIDGYGTARKPKVRGGAALLVLGAVFVGVAGGFGWQWRSRPVADSGPSSAIEWNAVQAVPTRTPDAEDVAWEKRAEEQDRPSTSAGRTEVGVIASPAEEQGLAIQTGLPRASGARNDIYVIDGDTFAIGKQHIRIAGMDAPETHPSRCAQEAQLGNAATAKLKELLGSGTVTIGGSGHDQYGRELRRVSVNGVDVAQTMISAGLASSYWGGKRQGWC